MRRTSQTPAVRRVGRAIRDGWLVVGATMLLCLALEGLYRGQAALRRSLRGSSATQGLWGRPDHPNAREPWWQEIVAGRVQPGGGPLRYDPFRGWWASEHRGRHVTVDSAGRRVTLQHRREGTAQRVVDMFGGSVMWGWLVRDSATIPALVAEHLRVNGFADVEVRNLAQSTFDLAQNAATLWQEIRHGRVPTVAVFLDGNNEIAPAFQSGRVGSILNEALIAQRFDRRTDLRSDLAALLRHSQLVQRLRRPSPQLEVDRSRLCGEIAGSYARQVEALTAVSTSAGFTAVFLWQPMRATSGKTLTPWERELGSGKWTSMVRRCTQSVDSAMALRPSLDYIPLHTLFDEYSESVFIDDFGHMTEAGSRALAGRIASIVADRLAPSKTRRGQDRKP